MIVIAVHILVILNTNIVVVLVDHCELIVLHLCCLHCIVFMFTVTLCFASWFMLVIQVHSSLILMVVMIVCIVIDLW